MSTDYGEKEREFLDNLKPDTGKDLGEWMQAISRQNLAHRNEIIDWLRQQGFMFAKASWLERIHHNGGKPIYADRPPPRTATPRAVTSPVAAPPPADPPPQPDPAPRPGAPHERPPEPAQASRLEAVLAQAKAYRPLAQYLLSEIVRSVPEASLEPRAGHVALVADHGEFAVLVVGPRELRLGLAHGADTAADGRLQAAKFTNPTTRISAAITHMVVLTDARQVDASLLALVASAARRAR